MPFMPWSEEFVLGIDQIDTQHHWLVDATNRLYEQVEGRDPDPKVVGEILEGLVDYTMNHFILEEDLFNRFGYPEAVEHGDEHNQFTAKAMDLLLRYESGEMVSEDTLEFLKNWLKHHILKVDKAYVPFLKSKGVN